MAPTITETRRTDRLGDALPAGAIARLGTMRLRHPKGSEALAYSPDGSKLASGGRDGTIRVFAAATGAILESLPGREPIARLGFSIDGQLLSVLDDANVVRVLDTLAWACVKEITLARERRAGVLSATWPPASAFAPSGQRVAVAIRPCFVALVDLVEMRVVKELRVAPDIYSTDVEEGLLPTVLSLAFTADGRTLVAATADGKVRSYDVVTEKKLDERARDALVMAATPGILAAAERTEERVHLLAENGRSIAAFAARGTRALAFGPRGALLACARRQEKTGCVELRDGRGELIRTHQVDAQAVAIAPDGLTLAAACGDQVQLFSTESGRTLFRPDIPRVLAIAFAPDSGRLVTGGADGSVTLHDPATGDPVHRLEGHGAAVVAVAVSRPGDVASVDETGQVLLRDPKGAVLTGLHHSPRPTRLAFSPDGNVLAMAGPSAYYDQSAERCWPQQGGGYGSTRCAWKANGRAAFVIGGGTIRLFGGKKRPELLGYGHDVAFASTGAVATSNAPERGVKLKTSSGERTLDAGPYAELAFSPDGALLVAASRDGSVYLLDVAAGTPRAVFTHEGGVAQVAFAPSGRAFATLGLDATVLVWETPAG